MIKYLLASFATFFSLSANAAAPDVTALVTEVGLMPAAIAAVGAAVLIVMVTVKAFKWIRQAL